MSTNRFTLISCGDGSIPLHRSWKTAQDALDLVQGKQRIVAELVPVEEMEELRKLLEDKYWQIKGLQEQVEKLKREESAHLDVRRDDIATIQELECKLVTHEPQTPRSTLPEDYNDPRVQRLWEAYLSLQGQRFESDGMQMLAAESDVEFFEERHSQEHNKP